MAGIAFIPYAGIQNDEALFAAPLYGPYLREYRARLFHHDIPLMLMSYLGTVKTWLYGAIFQLRPPDVWSVRLPMLLAGALAIWLFWRLLERSSGRLAALAGSALLAFDTTYLLTTVFDWGPVALQHLLLIGGCLCVLAGAQDGSRAKLGWGFFLFGLGMWDKALFSWTLGGVAIAALAVFPGEVRRRCNARNLAVAVLAFCMGALPLIVYNVRNPLKTFRGNTRFSTADFAVKASLVRYTAQGSALFGYLVAEDWMAGDHPKAPATLLERASLDLRQASGERRSGLLFWGFIAALALAPLWWRQRRPVLFGLIFLAVAWLQMAFTKDAGGGAHHVVLLWPFPHFVIACALAAAASRIPRGVLLAGIFTGAICLSNLLVTNQYFFQYVRDGAGPNWSDALGPLAQALRGPPERDVFVLDWGIFDTVRMLDQGKLTLWALGDVVAPGGDRAMLARILARPNALYVTHTPAFEVYAGGRDRLKAMAGEFGYQQELVQTIADSNGRPVFEVSRFKR